MPGAVARTSIFTLTNVTLPYVLKFDSLGCKEALACDIPLDNGLNVFESELTCRPIAESLDLDYKPYSH
jgi:alanine dehydrogenase